LIGVSLCQRAEYVALDPVQREQGNKADDDDRGGKEDRSVDLGRGTKDRREFSAKARRCRSFSGSIEGRAFGKVAKDVFHHDDSRIDDEAEVDGANRKEIGGFSPQDQDADSKEEGEWNRR